jgi:glycogen debranching enzyme
MAVGEGGYDPDSYHNGSVWLVDNAVIACGLRRYGLPDEVNRISTAILQAAPHLDYRLSEVFAEYSRSEVREPVELPRSCSRGRAWRGRCRCSSARCSA